jgi:hypothetical protein
LTGSTKKKIKIWKAPTSPGGGCLLRLFERMWRERVAFQPGREVRGFGEIRPEVLKEAF